MEALDIRAARDLAEEIGLEEFSKHLAIDYSKFGGSDGRKGSIHAWDEHGQYIGRFKTHERAVNQNHARVTRTGSAWFVWVAR